jgi:predicted nucleic acid-binding protein
MRDDTLVVADTSPLLTLARIDRLDLLETQFERIHAPKPVWNELTTGDEGVDELRILRDRDVVTILPSERTDLSVEIGRELDAGETAALADAIEQNADLVLLDERDGRRVARRHDLNVTGVIGMLLRGTRAGTVDLQAALDALRGAGFWIDDDRYSEARRRSDEEME